MTISKTAQAYTDTANTSQTTFTAASTALGNLVVVATFTGSASVSVSAIAGTGFTWSQIGAGLAGATIAGGTPGVVQLWQGYVNTVESTAVTCTASFAGGSPTGLYNGFYPFGEFTNGTGASTIWTVDGTPGAQTNAAATAMLYPTLSAALAGELYVGAGLVGGSGTLAATGTPTSPPFTFLNSVNGAQPACYCVLPASGSTGTIQQAAGVHTSSVTGVIGALLQASVPGPLIPAPRGLIRPQAVGRASLR